MCSMRSRMTSSLRFRLTAHILGVLGLGMAALCLFLYFAVRHVLVVGFDDWLHRESQTLAHVIEEHSKSRYTVEYGGIPAFEQREQPSYFQFWKPDGEVIARSRWLGSGDLPRRPGDYAAPIVFDGRLPDGRKG